MTTCRPWTTMTCGADSRPPTRHSTRRRRSWQATGYSLSPSISFPDERRIPIRPCASNLSTRSPARPGLGGMVGGQMLDLAAEGRFAGGGPQRLGEDEVRMLQAMKTGAPAALCLRGRRHARIGIRHSSAERSSAMDRPSAKPSKSPTIFWISKAIPRSWANQPARMRSRARQPWSASSARLERRRDCGS